MKRSTVERYRDAQGRSRPVRKRAKKRGPVPNPVDVFRRYKCQSCLETITNAAQPPHYLSLTKHGFVPKPVKLCPRCVQNLLSDYTGESLLFRKAWNG